ncbi:MAG: potassium channel family protein [Bacteroidota bacterium]
MSTLFREIFEDWFHRPRYLVLLLGLLLLIILPPVSAILQAGNLILYISYGLVLILAALFTTTSYREWGLLLFLGVFSFVVFVVWGDRHPHWSWVNAIVTFIFFSYVFRKLLLYILNEKDVTVNTIYAVICGYMILGVVFAPLLALLQNQFYSGSIQESILDFYDLIYYSFITLTTVGYGDIVPTNQIIKSVSIIIAITGQIYLTFVVAIIIGKYLASNSQPSS